MKEKKGHQQQQQQKGDVSLNTKERKRENHFKEI